MAPQITAILPTFRRPQFLKQAIESILDQTCKDFLIWVFDNASEDETEEVVNAFSKKDPRVHYFCHKKNIGMQSNFRFALQRVRTPFVSIVSDDDFLFPWFYKEAMEKLTQFPKAAFFSGTTVILDKKDRFLNWEKNQIKEGYSPPLDKHFLLPTTYWISSLFRTSISQKMNFQTNLISFDLDFLARICCQYPFYVSSRPCAGYRSHPTSFSVNLQPKEFFASFLYAKKRMHQESNIKKHMRTQIDGYMSRFYQHSFFMQGIKSIAQKDFAASLTAADILQKTFQDSFRSLLLKCGATACKKSSFFYRLACLLLFVRRWILISFRKRGLSKECNCWIEKYRMERS